MSRDMSDRLLVVDDDDAIRQTFRSFFSAAGFEVDLASNLTEAADRLATVKYAAVIVDICLTERGTEGLAIAAHVRQIARDLTALTPPPPPPPPAPTPPSRPDSQPSP